VPEQRRRRGGEEPWWSQEEEENRSFIVRNFSSFCPILFTLLTFDTNFFFKYLLLFVQYFYILAKRGGGGGGDRCAVGMGYGPPPPLTWHPRHQAHLHRSWQECLRIRCARTICRMRSVERRKKQASARKKTSFWPILFILLTYIWPLFLF
jgi:hypothetical protein